MGHAALKTPPSAVMGHVTEIVAMAHLAMARAVLSMTNRCVAHKPKDHHHLAVAMVVDAGAVKQTDMRNLEKCRSKI